MSRDYSFNVDAFTRDAAIEQGIPDVLVPSVVERAQRAKHAVERVEECVLHPLVARMVCRRVVGGAVRDHRAGVLERRCV